MEKNQNALKRFIQLLKLIKLITWEEFLSKRRHFESLILDYARKWTERRKFKFENLRSENLINF